MEQLSQNLDKHIKVHCVKVYGLNPSSESLIAAYLQPLYKTQTLETCLTEIQQLCGRLEILEIGKAFDVKLDKLQDGIEIVLNVQPQKTLTLSTGTEFGNNDGNFNASLTKRNLFGNGEKFEASAKYGTKTTSAFQFNLSKSTDIFHPENKIELSGYQNIVDNQKHSNHQLLTRALELNYKFLTGWGHQILGYSTNWRTIHNVGFSAGVKVREQAGDSLKSSIYHHILNENWKDPQVPSEGYSLNFRQELAGLKGDERFYKMNFNYHNLVELQKGWLIGMGFKSGIIYPLDKMFFKPNKPTHLADRFYMGNPTSLRGFRDFGIGPKDQNDVLGGDLCFGIGASLLTPLPFIDSNKLKGHIFVNAGNLNLYDHEAKLTDQIKSLLSKPKATVGFGLAYYHSLVRLEFNYCLPIAYSKSDWLTPKFQLGFGIDFL